MIAGIFTMPRPLRFAAAGAVLVALLGLPGSPAAAQRHNVAPRIALHHMSLPAGLAPVLDHLLIRQRTTVPGAGDMRTELTASDATQNDYFGWSVAVSGTIALVGASYENKTGAVYEFVNSGGTWSQRAKLTASDGVAGDSFGWAVAMSGNVAVIGAVGRNVQTGAAYVFVNSGGTWTQQAELIASDAGSEDQFGNAVAVSGGTIVVGAPFRNDQTGAAYVFVQKGTTWTQQAELTARDGNPGDDFGGAVAVSGRTVVVGASGYNSIPEGVVYVYSQRGDTWVRQAELIGSGAAWGDEFGGAVAVSGDTLLVGAPNAHGNNLIGAAYVFVRSGGDWTQQSILSASDAATADRFGLSVALQGSTAIIGAPGKNGGAGVAYVFVRNATTWTQRAELRAATSGTGDQFGNSVALYRTTFLVGEPAISQYTGAADVYWRS